MEITYLFAAFLQAVGVSLGVGSSTIAVASYIAAVKDGAFDDSERRLMKVVYTVLRVAMALILGTLIVHAVMLMSVYGMMYFSPFMMILWVVVGVLYANAILMTLHRMPMTLGPGIQAGSWYSLAVLFFFASVGLTQFSFMFLLSGYAGMLILGVVLVNLALALFRSRVA